MYLLNLQTKSVFIRDEKKQSIMEAFIWLVFVFFLLLKTLCFQYFADLNTLSFYDRATFTMLIGTFASGLFITGIVLVISNKHRLVFLLVVDIILSLILLADCLYFKYYYNVITIPVLSHIGLLPSVGDSIKSLFDFRELFYFADIPLILAGILYFKSRNKYSGYIVRKLSTARRLVTGLVIIAISSGILYATYSFVPSNNFIYDNNHVVKSMGVYYFHYFDIKRYVKDNFLTDRSITKEEIEIINQYFEEKKQNEPVNKKYTNAALGKNLIVVQLEAIQGFVINRKFNGKEITPNLNAFINDSAYFDDFYFQIGGGNTSDAEFLTNTSLHPLSQGAVYFKYATNKYKSTARLLKEKGYNTYAFHANTPSFWNRTEMYKALGFDRFFNSNDYKIDEVLGWGLSDESFFMQSLDKIDTSKPFYGFFVTLSSHHPFMYFESYDNFDVGEYEDTFVGNYIKAAHYVDYAVGRFLYELKRRGLYDNSVIVIYGDHSAFTYSQKEMLEDFIDYKDCKVNWIQLQKVPCFIRFPGMDNTGIHHVTGGEIDILPTIANLMGLEVPYAMGNDLFNTEKGCVVLQNSTVITDDYIYLYDYDIVVNRMGYQIDAGKYIDFVHKRRQDLIVSDIIIRKNALKYLK